MTVDSAVAHIGNQSLRVDGKGGYCDHVFIGHAASVPGLGDTIFGRFHVRFSDALGQGHTTFLAMKDAADGGKDLRMGGQTAQPRLNRDPTPSPPVDDRRPPSARQSPPASGRASNSRSTRRQAPSTRG
ncbi:MAG: hypothetical protein R3F14_43335 [Polyangiaceae bacterium]